VDERQGKTRGGEARGIEMGGEEAGARSEALVRARTVVERCRRGREAVGAPNEGAYIPGLAAQIDQRVI
jgi:hypothetical protein